MNKENKTSDKQQNGNDFIADVSGSVRIQIPLRHAQVLRDMCDGTLGMSENDTLNESLELVIKRLNKQIRKHYR